MKPETLLKKDLKSLYKLAWKYWSQYIRARDRGVCFTCGRKKPIAELDAGHFVHGGNGMYHFWVDFDGQNINSQCTWCNRYLHGNLGVYAVKIREKYGDGVVERLHRLKAKQDAWGKEDLIKIIESCKEYLKAVRYS